MYVAHNAFYLACILRGCDMSTGFFIRIYEYELYEYTNTQMKEFGYVRCDITLSFLIYSAGRYLSRQPIGL